MRRLCDKVRHLLEKVKLIMAENTEPCAVSNKCSASRCEGKAEVFLPSTVFYNPVQEFNRDLTISVIREHARQHFSKLEEKQQSKEKRISDEIQEKGSSVLKDEIVEPDQLQANQKYENGLRILEGLAASGLRSVRFALEILGVKEIVANDFDRAAVDMMNKNIEHNKVGHLVTPSNEDASLVMYRSRKFKDRFDVIDLDPYGSATQFLDGAVQAVKDGGVLCVTCTDMAVLCGNAVEKCHACYGAVSLKAKFCHEFALRILLQCIEKHANQYSRYIEPLLSISADFYIRVFVRVNSGAIRVKDSVTKQSMVYHCAGCGAFHLQPLAHSTPTKGAHSKYTPALGPPVGNTCGDCGFRFHLGGPIWSAPIHDLDFVQKMIANSTANRNWRTEQRLGTEDRILGCLTVVSEELQDQPLYYVTDGLVKILHCTPPSLLQIRSAILNAEYQVSLSHAATNSLKTNAPSSVMWDIMRCWVKENPVNMNRFKEGSPGRAILSRDPTLQVSFNLRGDANPKSRQMGLLRWQQNPERDWGPKPRAGRPQDTGSLEARRTKGEQKAQERKAKRKQQQTDDVEENPEDEKSAKVSRTNGEDPKL